MCLIAYQPAGKAPFAKSVFKHGWKENPDGGGFMYLADGKLVVEKPFYTRGEFYKAYRAAHIQHGKSSPFVLHFRWSTHGDSSETNIHPHILANGDAALVHNGVLTEFEPPALATVSDTVWFCRTVLAARSAAQLTSAVFNSFLAELIGWGNKFVLLDKAGNVSIVNSELGEWEDGCWFSNTSYRRKRPMLARSYKGSLWDDEGEYDRVPLSHYVRQGYSEHSDNRAIIREQERCWEEDRQWREMCDAIDRDGDVIPFDQARQDELEALADNILARHGEPCSSSGAGI